MVGYLEQAMISFLEDNCIKHGEIDIQHDEVIFKWIDGNISYNIMGDFELEFRLNLVSYDFSRGKLTEVNFSRTDV